MISRFQLGRAVPKYGHEARTDNLAVFDLDAQGAHVVRVHLSRRKGRRDAVGDEQRRVRDRLILSPGVEQIHGVVRMEIEEARNDGLAVGDLDALGIGRGNRQVAADAQDLAGADENSWISHTGVARRRKEPTAGDDDVAFLGRSEAGDEQ